MSCPHQITWHVHKAHSAQPVACDSSSFDRLLVVQMPWQNKPHRDSTGSGFAIEGKRIITNAHVVADTKHCQVRKHGEASKFTATVIGISHECDLAMLSVEDGACFWSQSSTLFSTLFGAFLGPFGAFLGLIFDRTWHRCVLGRYGAVVPGRDTRAAGGGDSCGKHCKNASHESLFILCCTVLGSFGLFWGKHCI